MKLLCSTEDVRLLGLLRSGLDESGIEYEIKNETIPYPGAVFSPEVWIVQDTDYSRAREVLDAARGLPERRHPSWICEACGENVEGELVACWKCGAARGLTSPECEKPQSAADLPGAPTLNDVKTEATFGLIVRVLGLIIFLYGLEDLLSGLLGALRLGTGEEAGYSKYWAVSGGVKIVFGMLVLRGVIPLAHLAFPGSASSGAMDDKKRDA